MEIKENQIFNLWNTNGRRRDVLNALKIYLEILGEIRTEYPSAHWANYPESVAQFVFYEKALQYSSDVFKQHGKYDIFSEKLGDSRDVFLSRGRSSADLGLTAGDMRSLDQDIEMRARHYTSNLVRFGFSDAERSVSDVGAAFLGGSAERDELERILPLDNVNLILLRQLLKFRVFSEPDANGTRTFYAPFFMALLLLFENDTIDRLTFLTVVQGINPYMGEEEQQRLLNRLHSPGAMAEMVWDVPVEIPDVFMGDAVLPFETFAQHIKNQKSGGTVEIYYTFYKCLAAFRENPCGETYAQMAEHLTAHKSKLQKAFGCGGPLWTYDSAGAFDAEEFFSQNQDNPLIAGTVFNQEVYRAYCRSKRADSIWEYSDTTERMLGATGLFRFSPMSALSCKEILACIFDKAVLQRGVFGAVSEEEYTQHERMFGRNVSIAGIFAYEQRKTGEIAAEIGKITGAATEQEIRKKVRSKVSDDFIRHIESKYPKEKIMQLLPLFSDRKNDEKIKAAVNDTADVPTIYEYIVGIAWYYISERDFDLYESFNLTLNADFEPVVHAGGGNGDIVIQYDGLAVMLEVTLMNKQAQKRGEWEPVLRHSLNLKAQNEEKETVTYFIADELDYNTINIWRAVAAVPLESTNTHQRVDGVMIMPFANKSLCGLLERNVSSGQILAQVKASFGQVPRISDAKWHETILKSFDLGV